MERRDAPQEKHHAPHEGSLSHAIQTAKRYIEEGIQIGIIRESKTWRVIIR